MKWEDLFKEEFQKEYFINLKNNIDALYQQKTIFPKYENIYKAFELTPLENVKVVIIGQDPYQTPGFANGLAFSVNPDIKIPKSLVNIYKELNNDLGIDIPNNGDLSNWAKSGVLLLNRILTVESGVSLSHKNMGWEKFTEAVIRFINKCDRKIVFILLGAYAQSVKSFLDNPKHLIIEAPHPSPLSAYHGFFGSKVFSRTCEYLKLPTDFWRLSWEKK